MSSQPLRTAVIIGSTRAGRFAPTVSRWFVGQAAARDDMTIDVVDLAEARLPETLGAAGVTVPEVAAVTARLAAADAFVVVTPEYNHSYPAALKSAIDWHYAEWRAKPVGFVSYGGQAGGLRAVEHLRQVFAELHAVTIRDTVSFHGAWNQFDDEGEPVDPDSCNAAAKVLLDQLAWWALALSEARAKRPYQA
ncbi:NADPH-dependent FMN reductase [Saccharothrix variisporea]|uniref:NAD(P)H-dependent FMN reductase n=1 Tax=Saccharothrix variisporea TaxID=543527 RepID=A0A495XJV6_9PSEU|nr:NAD(P)H-dependent oxidoreductase [Saccharothrix variisporea]RKT74710.1 NAD(P)H-dependent FMN reductase [Saccharothrix variisporea]